MNHQCNRCNDHDHHQLLINHPNFCFNKRVDLLVLVISSPENQERRHIIRETWGLEKVIGGGGEGGGSESGGGRVGHGGVKLERMEVFFMTGLSEGRESNLALTHEDNIYQVD